MGPINNNNFNWERALLKKRCGGNTNPQGSGKVNIDDIILTDDLLEKCRALDFDNNNQAITDWTFSDICTQDSCGILQSAFEDSDVKSRKGFVVEYSEKNIMSGPTGQTIKVDDEVSNITYTIFYDDGKYIVGKDTID